MRIRNNYNKILQNIDQIAKRSGRKNTDIQIVSISKTFSAEDVQEAIDSDIHIFGENKVQEAKSKFNALRGEFSFHLVGHLQSNKAKEAVKLFDLIHSVDGISIAEAINKEASKINKIQKILLQVNTSYEDTKSGCKPNEAANIIENISKLQNIAICGLMTIGPLSDNVNAVRSCFKLLRELKISISASSGINLKELSMGMSSDYEIAIEEGSTMIRIGSAIFGKRDYAL